MYVMIAVALCYWHVNIKKHFCVKNMYMVEN